MLSFSIGFTDADKVVVTVQDYECAPTGDAYGNNGLAVEVQVCAGGFAGRFGAAFLAQELERFRGELHALDASLNGSAHFATVERQLSLDVAGNGRGGLVVAGQALDRPGSGNRLAFEFALDQTGLAPVLRSLDEITARFPVRHNGPTLPHT